MWAVFFFVFPGHAQCVHNFLDFNCLHFHVVSSNFHHWGKLIFGTSGLGCLLFFSNCCNDSCGECNHQRGTSFHFSIISNFNSSWLAHELVLGASYRRYYPQNIAEQQRGRANYSKCKITIKILLKFYSNRF